MLGHIYLCTIYHCLLFQSLIYVYVCTICASFILSFCTFRLINISAISYHQQPYRDCMLVVKITTKNQVIFPSILLMVAVELWYIYSIATLPLLVTYSCVMFVKSLHIAISYVLAKLRSEVCIYFFHLTSFAFSNQLLSLLHGPRGYNQYWV